MRFLPALLLIAAPLLAQEPSEEERRAEEGRRIDDAVRAAEQDARTTEKRAEQIRRVEAMRERVKALEAELQGVAEELRKTTQATREETMVVVRHVHDLVDEILPLLAETRVMATELSGTLPVIRRDLLGARTIFLGQVGSEVIRGSADGTDYTLTSLGDGKYDLHATKRAEDGRLMEEWKEQGTMKELQEKYAFLRSGLAIQAPAVAALPVQVRWGESGGIWRGRVVTDGNAQDLTWNGGGRVGVNVTPPPEELRFHLGLPEGAGFIVQQVVPGSRAEQIGIRRMDILLKLDGELIDSPIQLKKLHEKTGVLEIIRRAETRKIDLAQVAEWKPAEVPQEKAPEPVPAEGAR